MKTSNHASAATPPTAFTRKWSLPPLILSPFSDDEGGQKLKAGSRASLQLQGLLPKGPDTEEDLTLRLLEGRLSELRMLFYLGRDLVRWLEMCSDMADRDPELRMAKVRFQSFAHMLITDPPASVRKKLKAWGVMDYRTIFSRAIGLNSVLAAVPERGSLNDDFIRHYGVYADCMFAVRLAATEYRRIRCAEFSFEVYASGEYSRLLEQQWGLQPAWEQSA